jgi:hypothetical protein
MEKIKIDLAKERAETDWQDVADKIYLLATPKYYEWMGWIAALSALKYLSNKHADYSLTVLSLIGYSLLIGYFQAFFYRFEFVLNDNWTSKKKRTVSLAISGLLTFLTNILVTKASLIMALSQT